jgi:hypothetical protein
MSQILPLLASLTLLPACRKSIPAPVPPPGEWTIGAIRMPPGPDGIAGELASLWKERNIDFRAGRPHAAASAQKALDAVRDYCRANMVRKGRIYIELETLPPKRNVNLNFQIQR